MNLYNNIINNNNFRLKKLFCYIYLSIKNEKDIKINLEDTIKQIIDEFKFAINNENEAKYGEKYLSDNLNNLFKIMEELNKIDIFEKIYDELEKLMINEIKYINYYKNVISQIKFQLGNFYFKNNLYEKAINFYEEGLLYYPLSNNDKIKNFILIKLSESYDKIGNKQKALNILNKSDKNNIIDTKDNKNNINININNNNNDEIKEDNDSIISSFEEKNNEEYNDFIHNQIEEKEESEEEIEIKEKDNKEEYNMIEEELNINKNKIMNINDIFSNEKSENVFSSKLMENFLSKKRRYRSSLLRKYSPKELINDKDTNKNKKEYDIMIYLLIITFIEK